jgi:hypothetical protein
MIRWVTICMLKSLKSRTSYWKYPLRNNNTVLIFVLFKCHSTYPVFASCEIFWERGIQACKNKNLIKICWLKRLLKTRNLANYSQGSLQIYGRHIIQWVKQELLTNFGLGKRPNGRWRRKPKKNIKIKFYEAINACTILGRRPLGEW